MIAVVFVIAAFLVVLAFVVLIVLLGRSHESQYVGPWSLADLESCLDPGDVSTVDNALAHMLRHYQVTIDDWGPEFEDLRFRWTVYDRRSDRAQFLQPLRDWSEVLGIGTPYMLGNALTAEQAYDEATDWMSKNPDLVLRMGTA